MVVVVSVIQNPGYAQALAAQLIRDCPQAQVTLIGVSCQVKHIGLPCSCESIFCSADTDIAYMHQLHILSQLRSALQAEEQRDKPIWIVISGGPVQYFFEHVHRWAVLNQSSAMHPVDSQAGQMVATAALPMLHLQFPEQVQNPLLAIQDMQFLLRDKAMQDPDSQPLHVIALSNQLVPLVGSAFPHRLKDGRQLQKENTWSLLSQRGNPKRAAGVNDSIADLSSFIRGSAADLTRIFMIEGLGRNHPFGMLRDIALNSGFGELNSRNEDSAEALRALQYDLEMAVTDYVERGMSFDFPKSAEILFKRCSAYPRIQLGCLCDVTTIVPNSPDVDMLGSSICGYVEESLDDSIKRCIAKTVEPATSEEYIGQVPRTYFF